MNDHKNEAMKNISWGKPVTHLFKGELWSILPISITGLPDSFEWAGQQWEVKPDHKFHVSLINGGYVKEVIGERGEEELTDIFQAACERANLSIAIRNPELRRCQYNEKNSIVAMCGVFGLEELFLDLESRLSAKFERPPTHVTLYGQGIPLSTKKHLAERSEILSGQKLEELKELVRYNKVFEGHSQ